MKVGDLVRIKQSNDIGTIIEINMAAGVKGHSHSVYFLGTGYLEGIRWCIASSLEVI